MTYSCIKRPSMEIHGPKTIFLESTFHKLSTNDLLVYQKTVYEDIQGRLFQVHKRKRRES